MTQISSRTASADKERPVLQIVPAGRDDIGSLVTRRPVPGPRLSHLDPFLFLNHHGPQTYPPNNTGLPFGPHPHRGFETVTFILEGSLSHHDTGGGESIVREGGVQWMTAGSGLVHAELSPEEFKKAGGPLEILQLWVNLPSRLKMVDPNYIEVPAAKIDTLEMAKGVTFKAVTGTIGAPVRPLHDITLGLLEFEAGTGASLSPPSTHEILFYVIRGEVSVNGSSIPKWHLARFGKEGEALNIESSDDTVILFGHAEPFREPIMSHGPFVMNTETEIRQAILDYQAGKFGQFTNVPG